MNITIAQQAYTGTTHIAKSKRSWGGEFRLVAGCGGGRTNFGCDPVKNHLTGERYNTADITCKRCLASLAKLEREAAQRAKTKAKDEAYAAKMALAWSKA